MNFPTLRELAEKVQLLVEKHPELADLPVYGHEDGSINLEGVDDIIVNTPEELIEKRWVRHTKQIWDDNR